MCNDGGINWPWKLEVAAQTGYSCGQEGKEKGGAAEMQNTPRCGAAGRSSHSILASGSGAVYVQNSRFQQHPNREMGVSGGCSVESHFMSECAAG